MAETQEPRDYRRYRVRSGGKVVHRGITNDTVRRFQEHLQIWPDAEMEIVGAKVTKTAALEWERTHPLG